MKVFTLLGAGLLLFSLQVSALEKANPKQVDEVHQRTQQLVPYDLDQSQLTFIRTVHGGVQHVIAKSVDNTSQIKLIQANLLKMVVDFRKGDFSVTEKIHGTAMPGLAQLKKAEMYDIKYEYKALPNGAQIHYSTEYPHYVEALHEWFDAQMKEHGSQVVPSHSQHHATPAE